MDPSCELLAVPQPSASPNVTIFWLYPTVKTVVPASTTPAGEQTPGSET
jgi:hypothetical protein